MIESEPLAVPKGAANVRNFCIIAHIDHGKTTLSDRLLEITRTIAEREIGEQMLDAMDLERERGITIKMHPVTLTYHAKDGQVYELNFIDTPGHVDFSSEVSRSLQACEGALLVIDAAQGIEAQTLANYHLALEQDLTIIPVINKIDLPSADVPRVRKEIEELLIIEGTEAIACSAKEGIGIEEILEAIVTRIPPPKGATDHLRGLIFDGAVRPVSRRRGLCAHRRRRIAPRHEVHVDGARARVRSDRSGRVQAADAQDGRAGGRPASATWLRISSRSATWTSATRSPIRRIPRPSRCPATSRSCRWSIADSYPNEGVEVSELRDALEKLALNDSALHFEPESSIALGFGFRCGFLGLLHMEIVQERLERNYNLDLIATSPSVVFRVTLNDGTVELIDNPAKLPARDKISLMEEPFVKATVITPPEYVGSIMELTQNRRGTLQNMEYLADGRVILTYEMPLIEVIIDYFDRLKSATKGYASLDYEVIGYREGDLVKLEIMLNGEAVDALSFIVARDKAPYRGRALTEKLKELIPRQMFDVPIQAVIGGKVVARETVGAMRKNVLAKCYGGDITRKRKLLEKQKVGKARMKRVGRVDLPQEAFMAVLQLDDE